VRFGQFTIFQHLMLKPAPTRLRLVLWSLLKGLQEFPEAPPPGLVTVPALEDAPEGYYPMAGYRLAGDRAIRIDMLERLADMIRGQDTRAGFEANPDMLSITGLTLEQFANLMQGLGYKAERGERPKVKAAQPVPEPAEGAETAEKATEEKPAQAPAEETPETAAEPAAVEDTAESVEAAEPEIEVYYTFTWAPRRRPNTRSEGRGDSRKDGRKGKPKGKPRGKAPREDKAKKYSARPPKEDKPVDPDNPFAALLALKGK